VNDGPNAAVRPPVPGGGADARPATRDGSPLLAGMITGILLALVWVLVVYVTHNGVPLVAWGVGGLIGVAVARSARPPTRETGTLAALLTVGTVLVAKVGVLAFALSPILEDEIRRNPAATTAVFLRDMVDHRSFSPELEAGLDSQARDGSDTALADLGSERYVRMIGEARRRAETATQAERERVVRAYTDALLTGSGFWSLLGRLFGLWDLLWLGLGVSTAWRLGRGIG